MVTCPRGLAVGPCCAIQKTGAVFVQEINACRAAMAKGGEVVLSRRVTISKMGGPIVWVNGEEPVKKNDATDAQRINIRKVAWELIKHTAENLRRERAGLTEAEAIVKTTERYPRLYELYSEGMRRGDAPEELIPAVPTAVVKANATKAEVEAEIRKRAEPIATAQTITTDQAGLNVLETPEGQAALRRVLQRPAMNLSLSPPVLPSRGCCGVEPRGVLGCWSRPGAPGRILNATACPARLAWRASGR